MHHKIEGQRTPLVQRRYRTSNKNRANMWTRAWDTIAYREDYGGPKKPFLVPLSHGGSLKVFVSLIAADMRTRLKTEMIDKVKYRQYRIQNTDEPRVHSLYNQYADRVPDQENDKLVQDDFDPLSEHGNISPGYSYAKIKMKSRPLSELSTIYDLTDEMAALCNIKVWNIGVNPICYRDGNDGMGMHADDNQNEEKIMTVLVETPTHGRTILVESCSTSMPDEQIRLILHSADGYEMDNIMQLAYKHGVPKDVKNVGENLQRLAIVFRAGKLVFVKKDSGRPIHSLVHRVKTIPYNFGPVVGLCVGERYSRTQLLTLKAHSGVQRAVSGKNGFGCDAIIISGVRHRKLQDDHFGYVLFAVENSVGAQCMILSAVKCQLIRVFRMKKKHKSKMCYRYDGLYKIMGFQKPDALRQTSPYLFVLKMWNWRVENKTNADPSHAQYQEFVRQEASSHKESFDFKCLIHKSNGSYEFDSEKLTHDDVPFVKQL